MPAPAKIRLADAVPTVDFESILDKLSPKARSNITRYLEAAEASSPSHPRDLWKRLFCVMASLCSHAIQTSGQIAVQFYIADGKHRLQVFALEAGSEGHLALYIPDCLQQAIAGGLIGSATAGPDGSMVCPIINGSGAALKIDSLTAAKTTSAPEFYKHMLGWNRKAIRVTLPFTAGAVEVHGAEILCVLGAQLRAPQGTPSSTEKPVAAATRA